MSFEVDDDKSKKGIVTQTEIIYESRKITLKHGIIRWFFLFYYSENLGNVCMYESIAIYIEIFIYIAYWYLFFFLSLLPLLQPRMPHCELCLCSLEKRRHYHLFFSSDLS